MYWFAFKHLFTGLNLVTRLGGQTELSRRWFVDKIWGYDLDVATIVVGKSAD